MSYCSFTTMLSDVTETKATSSVTVAERNYCGAAPLSTNSDSSDPSSSCWLLNWPYPNKCLRKGLKGDWCYSLLPMEIWVVIVSIHEFLFLCVRALVVKLATRVVVSI